MPKEDPLTGFDWVVLALFAAIFTAGLWWLGTLPCE